MCWITLEKGCDALAENCVVLRMGALATFLARMITLSGFLAAAERSAGASAAAWPGGCVPSAAPTPSCPPAAAPSASMAERLDFALCVVDKRLAEAGPPLNPLRTQWTRRQFVCATQSVRTDRRDDCQLAAADAPGERR